MAESPPQPSQVHLSNSQPQPHSITISTAPSSFSPQSSPSPPPPAEQPSQPPPSFGLFSFQKKPPIRVTSEFDSDSSIFFHKLSSKLFNGLAKLKFSFQNDPKGKVSEPQLAIITKHLAIHFDFEEQNALVKGFLDVGPNLKLKAAHDVKAQQGELTMVANLSDPGYKIELASAVPSIGLPKATLKFPYGEVSLEEKEDEEEKRILSVSGIVKGSLLNGVCTALYKDETLNLRYCYKDEEMSFIPSISLPSNAVSFAFKRRFGPSDKLSYWYNFDTNYWSTVYKHTVGKDYKFKAGYDSEVRLGWASLWVVYASMVLMGNPKRGKGMDEFLYARKIDLYGLPASQIWNVGDEGGKAKTAPMKMKVQFMLQVPQNDIKASVLMFRVKKRWDI